MEQITKRNGKIFYGTTECVDIDDAYERIRADYHRSIGRCAFLRLDRLGQRKERIHGFGFQRPALYKIPEKYKSVRVPVYLLGILHTSYCRIVGSWDIPYDDDEFIEAMFTKGSGILSLKERRGTYGRMNRRMNNKFR